MLDVFEFRLRLLCGAGLMHKVKTKVRCLLGCLQTGKTVELGVFVLVRVFYRLYFKPSYLCCISQSGAV